MFPSVETMKKFHFTNLYPEEKNKYIPVLHFQPVYFAFPSSSFLSTEIKEKERELYTMQNILAKEEKNCLLILTHINIWRQALTKNYNFIFVLTSDTWKLEEEKELNKKLQAYKTNCIIKISKGYIISKGMLEKILIEKWKQIQWKDLWLDLKREFTVINFD